MLETFRVRGQDEIELDFSSLAPANRRSKLVALTVKKPLLHAPYQVLKESTAGVTSRLVKRISNQLQILNRTFRDLYQFDNHRHGIIVPRLRWADKLLPRSSATLPQVQPISLHGRYLLNKIPLKNLSAPKVFLVEK